jgi:glycosyltransferase involved in cell wall biosynthesis
MPNSERLIRSVFVPDWREGNPYQDRLAEALAPQGVNVEFQSIEKCIFALNRVVTKAGEVDVLHIHWSNELSSPVVWSSSALKRLARQAILAADILSLRLRGVRVVWTVHNLVTHESPNPPIELLARRTLASCCSAVVVHSRSALRMIEQAYRVDLSRKGWVIPHGNYDGCYRNDAARERDLKERLGIDDSTLTLLFFGAVREYKGVLKLIAAFKQTKNAHLKLVIAGNPHDEKLRHRVIEAARTDPRIALKLEFIEDRDVAPLFALSNAVVIPFERALTSGSTVLAMTMGKATLLPEEAAVFDLIDDKMGIFFASAPEDLVRKLDALDISSLEVMGCAARAAADKLGWPQIGEALARVYKTRGRQRSECA